MPQRDFEDFPAGLVIELGSYTVSEAEIIAFARQFDPQPFHIDPEQAKSSIFGGLIASGWHSGAIFQRLMVGHFLEQGAASQGSPGVDEVRWLEPVRPGDTLRGRFTVVGAKPSNSRPTLGIVRSRGELINQRDEVVFSALGTGFFSRRPSA